VSAVAFDNTILSVLLNPDGKPVNRIGTTEPVELAKERSELVVAQL
jgi:hypothetical protein